MSDMREAMRKAGLVTDKQVRQAKHKDRVHRKEVGPDGLKRERREREDMYARLAKNDHVLTIGGVVGTIVSVKDDQVVVKVDESTNTKMTFMKSAIQKIMSDDQSLSIETK